MAWLLLICDRPSQDNGDELSEAWLDRHPASSASATRVSESVGAGRGDAQRTTVAGGYARLFMTRDRGLTAATDLHSSIQDHLWFHSFEFGDGLKATGIKPVDLLHSEWTSFQVPDLLGKSVLDIGAWDGWFSFRAEAAGASRVVALDHYAWAMDHALRSAYHLQCKGEGRVPDPYDRVPQIWDNDSLPGKRGFDLAKKALGSNIEVIVAEFPNGIDAADLGQFDVVLLLGVLYHLENPLEALRKAVSLTRGVCIIETVCMVVPGQEHHPLWELFPSTELNDDPSNWWAANAKGIEALCLAAGFQKVAFCGRPAVTDPPHPGYDYHYGRAVVHAFV
jgi:tRNA (mo5U34)-methyltransferase